MRKPLVDIIRMTDFANTRRALARLDMIEREDPTIENIRRSEDAARAVGEAFYEDTREFNRREDCVAQASHFGGLRWIREIALG